MPLNLYVIRHGQSEANVIIEAGKRGDMSLFTEENVTVPDRSWRLTPTGVEQARAIGEWVRGEQPAFDRYITSPFIRTRETAGNLGLPDARWQEMRVVRERSWGEISTMGMDAFEEQYPNNAMFKRTDPLYWRPPAGESIADVAENRVHNLLSNLRRDSAGEGVQDAVVVVSHGDFMGALRLCVEDLTDERYLEMERDKTGTIRNCQCLHYTRKDPRTGRISDRLSWGRVAVPVADGNGGWKVDVSGWHQFGKLTFHNDQLVGKAENIGHHLNFGGE